MAESLVWLLTMRSLYILSPAQAPAQSAPLEWSWCWWGDWDLATLQAGQGLGCLLQFILGARGHEKWHHERWVRAGRSGRSAPRCPQQEEMGGAELCCDGGGHGPGVPRASRSCKGFPLPRVSGPADPFPGSDLQDSGLFPATAFVGH